MKAFILMLSFGCVSLVFAKDARFLQYNFTHFREMEETLAFISKYNPKLDLAVKEEIASAILKTSTEKKLDYRLLLSIIAVESSFKPKAISKTGDFSLVQINYRTWAKEFKRLKRKSLCLQRLTKDISYSVEQMGEILTIIRAQSDAKDKQWFARYHSKTPSLKKVYAQRVLNKNIFTLVSGIVQ